MPTGLRSRQIWVREADLDFVSLPGVFQLLAADKEPWWGKRELKQTYITGRGRCYSRCSWIRGLMAAHTLALLPLCHLLSLVLTEHAGQPLGGLLHSR